MLRRTSGVGNLEPEIANNIERYLTFTYYQHTEDWNSDEIFTASNLSIKKCKPADLGGDAYAEEVYKGWNTKTYSFDLFCPDYDKSKISLFNTKGAMNSKAAYFRIEKCRDPENQPGFCKPEAEINSLISDLAVQMWTIHTSHDIRHFHEEAHRRSHELNVHCVIGQSPSNIIDTYQV